MKYAAIFLCASFAAGAVASTVLTKGTAEVAVQQPSELIDQIDSLTQEKAGTELLNTEIDMEAFLIGATETAVRRESKRVTEQEFLAMAAEDDVVIFDARSKTAFDLLHVKGAMNLSFSDIAEETLEIALPDKDQKILIYCNNNFENGGIAMMSKIAPTSLNLSTYATLNQYGYNNVFELLEYKDVDESILPLVGKGVDNPELLKQSANIFITFPMDEIDLENITIQDSNPS